MVDKIVEAAPAVEVDDIQATVLRPRPSPYKGEYVVLRIDDAVQGREMLRRIIPYVAPAEEWWVPSIPAWLGIAFSYQGLKALGLPQASLDSFPEEFRQGMAARAETLRDIGDNAPANWEYPFGTSDAHVTLAIYSRDDNSFSKLNPIQAAKPDSCHRQLENATQPEEVAKTIASYFKSIPWAT